MSPETPRVLPPNANKCCIKVLGFASRRVFTRPKCTPRQIKLTICSNCLMVSRWAAAFPLMFIYAVLNARSHCKLPHTYCVFQWNRFSNLISTTKPSEVICCSNQSSTNMAVHKEQHGTCLHAERENSDELQHAYHTADNKRNMTCTQNQNYTLMTIAFSVDVVCLVHRFHHGFCFLSSSMPQQLSMSTCNMGTRFLPRNERFKLCRGLEFEFVVWCAGCSVGVWVVTRHHTKSELDYGD